jgi:uncharacterized membrane protein YkoI
MSRKVAIPAMIMAAAVATAGGLAFAKSSAVENDALGDLAHARITLAQAAAAAEAHVGGRATRAELNGERGTAIYEIEIVGADQKVLDVRIDAGDGKVLSTKQDQADRRGKDEDDD